ncbi:MAG: type IX secretion system protein PorQ [Bacteroidales bacterium]|nr:type IX secretion system protein PorQ [Bacteroidales bacterium]
MRNRGFVLLGVLCLMTLGMWAQTGGRFVYNFLNFSNSSRIAGLGGGLIASGDDDPSLLLYNPSLIGSRHHTALEFNMVDYFSNASYGSAMYSHTFNKVGSFVFGMQFVNYGKFTATDENGYENGYFHAGDYAATVGWGRMLDSSFSIGADLKLIYSAYESYRSFGLAVDVAGSYINAKRQLALSLLVKNIGTTIVNYVPGQRERLPFDIQLAFSQKFKFLPVRYHISLHHLYRWNMRYAGELNPLLEYDAMTGEPIYPNKAAQFFDNFFRHINFAIEIIPAKFLSFQLAYNHNRRQDMYIPQKRTLAGFSYGFMLNIKSIRIGFSRVHYAKGATPNYFNFSVNINELSQLNQERKAKKLQRLESVSQ